MDNPPSVRLLYAITEAYPTHRADIKALFGRYLPRAGVASDLVAYREQSDAESEAWGGGRLITRTLSGGAMKLRITSFVHIVASLIRTPASSYDAIQIRDMPVVATLAYFIATFKRRPFFYWMSYPIPEGQIDLARQRKLNSGLMKFLYPYVSGQVGRFLLYHFVLKLADHIFVQSDMMKEELVAKGFSGAKMTAVPMGVDLELLDELSIDTVREPRFQDKPVLVYLGILERARKIWVLFDMLEIVLRKYPDTVLIIVGDTPDTDHRVWLQDEAKRRGLEHAIVWTGWLPTKKTWHYVKQSDIALSPYPRGHLLDSASPTKVAEYMALGIPTVANDQPDQAYTLSASGAGVYCPYSGETFAAAVIDLLDNPGKRKQMALAGPPWVAENRSYGFLTPLLAKTYFSLVR